MEGKVPFWSKMAKRVQISIKTKMHVATEGSQQ
jgi:hypothetical protein